MANTVNIPALSTLGVKFGYGIETTAGVKPTSFKWLPRCTDISEITLDTETIDASALEDYQTRYIAGRQDTGGAWDVSFHFTPETRPLIKTMMSESAEALKTGLRTWFEVWSPSDTEAYYVVAQPGSKIPLPAISQNTTYTGSIVLAIDEIIEFDEAIEPVLSTV